MSVVPFAAGNDSLGNGLLAVASNGAAHDQQMEKVSSGRFLTDAELAKWTPAPELVAGLLSSGEVNLLFAPKNRGKTFLGLHLAYSVATKQPDFLGCKIRKFGSVVYLCAEGRGGLVKRRAAWLQAHGWKHPIPRLAFWRDLLDIRDEKEVTALIEAIREHYPDCVLVIIDTLSQHMPGGDEGTSDMSAALHGCQRIRDALGLTVLAIHHPSKGKEDNERGGSGFRGGCADVLNVEDKGGMFVLKTLNARDRGKDTAVPYGLEVVTLDGHQDEDGRPLTSCVVRRVTDSVDAAKHRQKDAEMDRMVLAGLAKEPLAATPLARTINKRNKDVNASLQRLHSAGQVQRQKRRWMLVQ